MRLIPFFMAMLMMAACGVDESEPALPADLPAETPAPLAPPPALALPNGDKIDVEQLSGPAPFTV